MAVANQITGLGVEAQAAVVEGLVQSAPLVLAQMVVTEVARTLPIRLRLTAIV